MDATTTALVTAEEYAQMDLGEGWHDLIEGVVIMSPWPGGRHDAVERALGFEIEAWARSTRSGRYCGSALGYLASRGPDTVRAADGSYFAEGRAPSPPPLGAYDVMPDLVIEVVSPHDRRPQVLAKAGEWLDCGVRVVILAWPAERTLTVCRDGEFTTLHEADTLTVPDILPGFALPVARVFAGLAA